MLFLAIVGTITLQTHPIGVVDSIVRSGVSGGVYPGAVVAIGTADSVLFLRGYGGLTWQPSSAVPSPHETLYDLASLTKVVSTTPALMYLVDRGQLSVSDPVSRYVPDFKGAAKGAVTIAHLLTHTSGLRAFLPLHTLTETAPEARARVVQEPLQGPPGRQVVYSDLNAMLLGWVVEGASSLPLDEFVRRNVFEPLEMSSTRYGVESANTDRVAPINRWRGHPIAGVVHDQNAARLGGVSGHAGLYSTAQDLAAYARFYLRRGRLRSGTQLISEATVAEFVRRRTGNRAYGWEVKDTTEVGSAGSATSSAAFGHGGYTGTSIWIDPDLDLFVVLLTNRVYAPRTAGSIRKLRGIRGDLADAGVLVRAHACRIQRMTSGTTLSGCKL